MLPRFETERLVIMPLSTADVGAVQALTDDPAITEVVQFLRSPFTCVEAAALIGKNDDKTCFLGAFLQDELVGILGTHAHGDDRLEIGYWIGTKFQRKGYAAEAASASIALLRTIYPDRQMTAECKLGNDASWALLHKLGFRPTGRRGDRPGRELLAIER